MQYTTVHDRQLTRILLTTAVDCCQCSAVWQRSLHYIYFPSPRPVRCGLCLNVWRWTERWLALR